MRLSFRNLRRIVLSGLVWCRGNPCLVLLLQISWWEIVQNHFAGFWWRTVTFPSDLRRCLGRLGVGMHELAPGEEGKVPRCLWTVLMPPTSGWLPLA